MLKGGPSNTIYLKWSIRSLSVSILVWVLSRLRLKEIIEIAREIPHIRKCQVKPLLRQQGGKSPSRAGQALVYKRRNSSDSAAYSRHYWVAQNSVKQVQSALVS